MSDTTSPDTTSPDTTPPGSTTTPSATTRSDTTPPDSTFHIAQNDPGTQLSISIGAVEIATYVYAPATPQVESPKPYLHPLRTLSGAPVSVFRPWDHRWHKGLQMTWSHISGQNFWGGPTFDANAPDHGYVWRNNNGSQLHRSFDRLDASGTSATVVEHLDWSTSTDEIWLTETRTLRFHSADPDRGIWALDFDTALTNTHTQTLELGSPTTHGRPNAGYTGLFWRGPRAFTGAPIIADTAEGNEVMGSVGRWAAISGEHDELDGGATVLAFAGTSSAAVPIKWFSRSEQFACLNPSPAFDEEIKLDPGQNLELRHRFVFIDQVTDRSSLEPIAEEFAL